MLKTRLQTAFFMALFFASLFIINNTVLWFFSIAAIALLISYEWRHMPEKIVASSHWQYLLGVDFLKLSIKSIALTALGLLLTNIEVVSLLHQGAAVTFWVVLLKIFSICWLIGMLIFLKKDTTQLTVTKNTENTSSLQSFADKNPIFYKVLFKLMPFVLPLLIMANLVHLLISVERMAPIPFILLILGLVWLSDSLAYFAGKKWGKRKLAPNISPNKTWEGAIIGNILATLIIFGIYMAERYRYEGFNINVLFFIAFLAVLAVLGDLFQSKLKRVVGVKDSSQFLPGHGGFFDRFDAMIPVLLFSIW